MKTVDEINRLIAATEAELAKLDSLGSKLLAQVIVCIRNLSLCLPLILNVAPNGRRYAPSGYKGGISSRATGCYGGLSHQTPNPPLGLPSPKVRAKPRTCPVHAVLGRFWVAEAIFCFVDVLLFCTAKYSKNAVLVETIHISEPASA